MSLNEEVWGADMDLSLSKQKLRRNPTLAKRKEKKKKKKSKEKMKTHESSASTNISEGCGTLFRVSPTPRCLLCHRRRVLYAAGQA